MVSLKGYSIQGFSDPTVTSEENDDKTRENKIKNKIKISNKNANDSDEERERAEEIRERERNIEVICCILTPYFPMGSLNRAIYHPELQIRSHHDHL